MSDTKALIERLRTRGGRADGFGLGPICDEAAATIARLDAERDAARAAIELHNAGCVESCNSRSCAPFLERGRLCPECPRDWMIDGDAIRAAMKGEP